MNPVVMDMKFVWNEWYATLTATQFSICMFLFVYVKWNRTPAPIKFIKVYVIAQWLLWFLNNLSFVQVIPIDKGVWEILESMTRLVLLIVFYGLVALKTQFKFSMIIGLPLLLILLVFVVWMEVGSSIPSIVRVLSACVAFALSLTFYRGIYKELSVGRLEDYYIFWFNTAFFFRSGGIVWFTVLIALYSPERFIDPTLLDISFSILAILEYLILLLGIVKQKSRNRYL